MTASIVVSNYNYGRFVAAAIDSALAQTVPAGEIVVVDDGSTDDSQTVIAEYGRRVVTVLKDNGGQTSAFNAGLAHVTSEAVIFLDADDILLPTAVATAVEHLSAGAIKVHWPLWVIDADGRRTGDTYPRHPLPSGDLRESLLRAGPAASISPPTSGNAFDTEWLRQHLPLPEVPSDLGSASVDAYLSTLAALEGTVAASPEPRACYRMHGDNDYVTRSFADRLAHDLRQFEHRCDALAARCRELGLPAAPERWRQQSWLHRVARTRRRLGDIVGAAPFVLVDDGEWGLDFLGERRRALPLVERGGEWWGPPEDDARAIAELSRLRTERRAEFIAFGWPALWWLDHYKGLRDHLERHHRRIAADADLVVFALGRERRR